ncbi:MAG: biotin attachment protein [Desulfocurvibacter africanus]
MDVKALLEEIKASPYEEIEIRAPHTGVIEFAVKTAGGKVFGPAGTWKEKPGTLLAHVTRERNKKPIHAPQKGEIKDIAQDLSGKFVEAGTRLMTLRHFLSRDEVIEAILKKTLHLVTAPEKAKYYFVPEVDQKIKASGIRSIKVTDGMDLFIMSRMKREALVSYTGPEGQIYSAYFAYGENIDSGQPLIGVCPGDQFSMIQEVVAQVRSEWKEID